MSTEAIQLAADASLFSVDSALALLTLTTLEVVLGIDNIVVISIVTGKLPEHQQAKARTIGLALAMLMRILLLLAIGWLMTLTQPLFEVFGHGLSGKDLILLIGGLFLIYKATHEIHANLEGVSHEEASQRKKTTTFAAALGTILAMDLVFSLDSVITAVGMAQHIEIMIVAVIIAVIIMMIFAGPISHFIKDHPTIKMLALSFLLLIGVILTAEGLGKHIEKAYIYFAMGFSLIVELINLRVLKLQKTASATAHTP